MSRIPLQQRGIGPLLSTTSSGDGLLRFGVGHCWANGRSDGGCTRACASVGSRTGLRALGFSAGGRVLGVGVGTLPLSDLGLCFGIYTVAVILTTTIGLTGGGAEGVLDVGHGWAVCGWVCAFIVGSTVV